MLLTASVSAETVKYRGMFKGSSMKIDGTSTVHDWTVESKLISGNMELEGGFPSDLSLEDGTIQVLSMISAGFKIANFGSNSDCPMDAECAVRCGLRVNG